MCVLGKVFEVLPDQRRDENDGDPTAGLLRQTAARMVTLTFVPGENDKIVGTIRLQRRDQWIESLFEPLIRDIERTVVGTVAKVGGDKDEVRKCMSLDV